MKTKEELNALKEEVENLNKKLAELSEEELAEVVGGTSFVGGLVGITEGGTINNCYNTGGITGNSIGSGGSGGGGGTGGGSGAAM